MSDILTSGINLNSSPLVMSLVVLTATVATFLTRVTPFWIFKKDKPSKWLLSVERHMGLFIMVILVFYALKDTNFKEFPFGGREIVSAVCAILIHLKFKNALLSIVFSTALYMFLLRIW